MYGKTPQNRPIRRRKKLPLLERLIIFAISLGITLATVVYVFQWASYFKDRAFQLDDWPLLIQLTIVAWLVKKVLTYLLKFQVRALTK